MPDQTLTGERGPAGSEPVVVDAAPADRLAPESRLVISLLLVSAFVVILNETIMGVALPSIMADLGITASTGQWLTTAFMLTMAVVIPISGYLLQRFTTRQVFAAAMVLFSLGTLLGAIAPGFGGLVLARVVQASGTAIMMPLLMTTVMSLVPPHLRGRTMGNISIVISVAPALGPTISGFILSVLDWRWLFWLVLPISLGALALGLVRVRNVSEPRPTVLDVISVVLSAFAFGGLIYGLSAFGAAAQGEAGVDPWLPLGVGAAALVVFVLRQLALQRRDRALLDLRTFVSPTFSISVGLMLVMMMALFGTIILLPIYTQDVLGLEPLTTGLLLLPGGLTMGLLGPVVGRAYDRHGPWVLLVPGAVLVAGMLWLMTTFGTATPAGLVLGAHLVLSIGLALMFTPLFTTAMGSVTPNLYSHASAVVGTVQQLAGAAGTALFVVVMATRSSTLVASGAADVEALASGIRAAFVCGGVLALLALVAAFFVRAPQERAEVPAGAGH